MNEKNNTINKIKEVNDIQIKIMDLNDEINEIWK